MKLYYFASARSLEEAETLKRRHVLELHPDRGGTSEEFAAMMNEFRFLQEMIEAIPDCLARPPAVPVPPSNPSESALREIFKRAAGKVVERYKDDLPDILATGAERVLKKGIEVWLEGKED